MSAGTVLVTGVGGGLGAAAAGHLVSLGYDVIGWDSAEPNAAEWYVVDVSDFARVKSAAAQLPSLTAVVHFAGVSNRSSLATITADEFASVITINTLGTFHVAKAVFPALQAGSGTFVALGSVAGSSGFRNRSAYSTSKAAVAMFVKSIAIEWAPAGVRAVCLSPGFVDAGMSIRGQAVGATPSDAIIAHTPLGRLTGVDEIASTVAFLISDAAGGITGSEIIVDAGFSALSGF